MSPIYNPLNKHSCKHSNSIYSLIYVGSNSYQYPPRGIDRMALIPLWGDIANESRNATIVKKVVSISMLQSKVDRIVGTDNY